MPTPVETCTMYEAVQPLGRLPKAAPNPGARKMYVAVGDDGWRPVVWGLGRTLQQALREAHDNIDAFGGSAADKDALTTASVTAAQAAIIADGDITWPAKD